MLPSKVIAYLQHTIQACINVAYFPIAWKVAKIAILNKPEKSRTNGKPSLNQPPECT